MAASDLPIDTPDVPVPAGTALLPCVLVLAAEACLSWGFLVAGWFPHWGLAIGLHVLVCAALAAWTMVRGRQGADVRALAWLFWMTLTLGPAGPVAAMILLALIAGFNRTARPFDEWYRSLFPDDEENVSERLYHRLITGREDALVEGSVTSLTDVLATGNTRAKQAVVALLARRFRADFAPALRMALNDREASIRVQAATAAATIDERYHARRLALEAASEMPGAGPEAVLELARHLDEYGFSGVLDADRQRLVMTDALAAYRKARESIDTASSDIDISIGRLLLRLDRLEEAERFLASADRSAGDTRPALWRAECLYRLRRFSELRECMDDERLSELALDETQSEIGPVINLWQIARFSGLDTPQTDSRQ